MPFRQRSVLEFFYTVLAPAYTSLTDGLSSRARATGRRWLDVTDGEYVLDVGCGPGRDVQRLASATPSGWTDGLDATPAMLSRAQRRTSTLSHDRHALRQGDARALPYADDRFDALFSAYLLDLLPPSDLLPTLAEFRRVLRPDGSVVLVTMAPPNRFSGRVWATVAQALPLLLGGSRPVALRRPLRSAGFDVRRRTVRRQAGLPSAIIEANPMPAISSPSSN